ncbi:hypothetical protein ES702_05692 [subsurface metagenome]
MAKAWMAAKRKSYQRKVSKVEAAVRGRGHLRTFIIVAIVSILFVVSATGLQAQTQVQIKDCMSPTEFRSCGLGKL